MYKLVRFQIPELIHTTPPRKTKLNKRWLSDIENEVGTACSKYC